jgi:NitT/TauT family transport system substrate-binding protein
MNLKRRIALAAAALAFAAGPAFGQAKEKVVLLLNWYTYSEHAPFYLGKERGYFDQESRPARRASATPTCRR